MSPRKLFVVLYLLLASQSFAQTSPFLSVSPVSVGLIAAEPDCRIQTCLDLASLGK